MIVPLRLRSMGYWWQDRVHGCMINPRATFINPQVGVATVIRCPLIR